MRIITGDWRIGKFFALCPNIPFFDFALERALERQGLFALISPGFYANGNFAVAGDGHVSPSKGKSASTSPTPTPTSLAGAAGVAG
jgi:hypothetical protein